MLRYTVEVDGIMCGMCEAHVNEAIRREFAVKKVTTSHKKKETVILTEEELDEEKLKKAIASLGYDMGKVKKEPYQKKGLFSRF